MIFIKLLFICCFVFPFNSFSQGNLKNITTNDSTSNINSITKEKLQFNNFFRYNSKKIMDLDAVLGLKLYGRNISDSLLLINISRLNWSEYSETKLTNFKESFHLVMEIAQKNRYKYDLGELGSYLGISRDILAIILAIISVAK